MSAEHPRVAPTEGMRIVEVSQVDLSEGTGMGRVGLSWQEAFLRAGHAFEHVGPSEIGRVHPARFASRARAWVASRAVPYDLALVHEPAAAPWVGGDRPVLVYSHGIERRGWECALRWSRFSGERIAWKSRLAYPWWRLGPCDRGLRRGDHVFVLNQEDRDYCLTRYARAPESVSVIRNGVDSVPFPPTRGGSPEPTVLFVGSWLPRKGIHVLARAAEIVRARGVGARWILAGTGRTTDEVLADWPRTLAGQTEIRSGHDRKEEEELFSRADLFVLPSFYEGQPLALLQAMAAGLCCVTTATCGQRDLIRNRETGLLVELGDAEGLAAAIMRALADDAERRAMGAAARASTVGRSWEETGDEFVRATESAMRVLGAR